MSDARHLRGFALAGGLACLCFTLSAWAAPSEVQELQFGDALFYFYQDDYFTAITRMSAALERGQLEYHDEEAQLLLGGMHLAYGQHRRAATIFESLLASRSVTVRDRAWFYLARLRFQRGFLADASAALASIEQPLAERLEPLRQQLIVQLLMAEGRYSEAAEHLNSNRFKGHWAAFMQFNLGVALIHAGQYDAGEQTLAELGKRKARTPELRALRDRAQVTRAFSLLRRGNAVAARAALDHVRLDGPYSNKALLGAAWADIEQEKFRPALVPLKLLSDRPPKDSAVQEALLAAPYALASLKASRQAAEAYEHAINAFSAESSRLATSISAVREGKLVKTLVGEAAPRTMGWFWRIDDIADAPESRYLYELMADHTFQENLKNYRDLLFLRSNLAEWQRNIGAYDDMLTLARRAHAERLPKVSERYAALDLEGLATGVATLSARLEAARNSDNPGALANGNERAQIESLARLESVAIQLEDTAQRQAQLARIRRLRGVLQWDLQAARSERLWQIEKSLRHARRQLGDSRLAAARLEAGLVAAPGRFAGFETRIDDAHNRLLGLSFGLEKVILAQESVLNESAVNLLAERKEVLDAFALQARFALAAVYDRAAAAEGAP